MHDISDLDPDGLPSNRRLVKATLVALAIAGALLVTTILPAEYGIDPTGVGKATGLTALHASGVEAAAGEPTARGPLREIGTPYRSNTLTVPLAPHQGAEIKAVMDQGQGFVFQWKAEGGPVYVDMHGEPPDAPQDVFTSFRVAESLAGASGSFTAPFKGVHGWYWENRGDTPVTIHLQTSGFYETLYMP
ncbi:hypothetical protein G3580_18805 [Nitrogeniibacter mangrovi]|uniref:Transmembrane anchor protein n=1 Tax=Nitrogeniibacter mangrovi TaxID=2016596 RepID=A0A6C1BAN5_9RHOO|nr:hypothetical protein G3580_18805 [Nitrogeniibacter mangrovi]